jgi:FdhD protein
MPDAPSTVSLFASVRTETTGTVKLWSCESDQPRMERLDTVAVEEPLEIRVRGRCVAVTMRTPGHDAELAVGFLLTEGLIRSRAEVLEVAHCQMPESALSENVINVFLAPSVEVDFERLTRHVYTTSSCGLCGKSSIESVHQHFPPISPSTTVSRSTLSQLPDRLRAVQEGFNRTGGLHAAAVFNHCGELVVLREDVGRHNAVDKVIGFGCLGDQLPFESHILLVSGRASVEIVQKALAARIPVVAAISAPTNLAVDFARESGQTLVGFLRGQGMNIYSESARIT